MFSDNLISRSGRWRLGRRWREHHHYLRIWRAMLERFDQSYFWYSTLSEKKKSCSTSRTPASVHPHATTPCDLCRAIVFKVGTPSPLAAIADVQVWHPGLSLYADPGLRPLAFIGMRPFAFIGLRPFANTGLQPFADTRLRSFVDTGLRPFATLWSPTALRA